MAEGEEQKPATTHPEPHCPKADVRGGIYGEPEKVHIISQGVRCLAKGGASRRNVEDARSSSVKKVLIDLRSIRNPAQVASHRGHTGYFI